MKKHFVILFAFVFALAFNVNGQSAHFSIPTDLEGEPGTSILVPLDADFADICSFEIYLQFDPDVVTFVGLEDLAVPTILHNMVPGTDDQLRIIWVDFGGAVFEGELLKIHFLYNEGDTPVAFVEAEMEITDCSPDLVPIDFTTSDGFISEAPPIPLAYWAIFLGVGLVVAFVVLRMTRVF